AACGCPFSSFQTETLHRRPHLDQRSIDREILVRAQGLDLRIDQYRRQEATCDVAFQQPVAVLGEHRLVHTQASIAVPSGLRRRLAAAEPTASRTSGNRGNSLRSNSTTKQRSRLEICQQSALARRLVPRLY